MLKSIQLARFKSIREPQTIEFRPLNLLFGPNSAGKSSILQALLLLQHGFRTGSFNPSVVTQQDQQIDLGGLLNLIHGRDPRQSASIHFSVEVEGQLVRRAGPEMQRKKRTLTWELELGVDRDQDDLVLSDRGGVQRCRLLVDGNHLVTLERVPVIESGELEAMGIHRVLAVKELGAAPSLIRAARSALIRRFAVNDPRPPYPRPREEITDLMPLLMSTAVTDFAISEQDLFQHRIPNVLEEDAWLEYHPRYGWWELADPQPRDLYEEAAPVRIPPNGMLRYLPAVAAHDSACRELYQEWWNTLDDNGRFQPAAEVGRLFAHYLRDTGQAEGQAPRLFDLCYSAASFRSTLATLINTAVAETGLALGDMEYLGPLRRLPGRRIGQGRGRLNKTDAWSVLLQDEHVRRQVNRWLGPQGLDTAYVLRRQVLYDGGVVRNRQELAFNDGLKTGMRWLAHSLRTELERRGGDSSAFDQMLEAVTAKAITPPGTVQRGVRQVSSMDGDEPVQFEAYEMPEPPVAPAGLELPQWLPQAGRDVAPASLDAQEHFARSFEDYSQVGLPITTELVLWDKRHNVAVSVPDVGTGISQVVPVLVHAEAESNKTIAIEQPELHLHPALQAELADTLITSVRTRQNMLLLETHSEHLMLRLLRRIRETTDGELPRADLSLCTGDVLVVFAEPSRSGSRFREVRLTPDGEFEGHWPKGFFADRSKELM